VVEAAAERITGGVGGSSRSPSTAFRQAVSVVGVLVQAAHANTIFHIAEIVAFVTADTGIRENRGVRAVEEAVLRTIGEGTGEVRVVGAAFQRIASGVSNEEHAQRWVGAGVHAGRGDTGRIAIQGRNGSNGRGAIGNHVIAEVIDHGQGRAGDNWVGTVRDHEGAGQGARTANTSTTSGGV